MKFENLGIQVEVTGKRGDVLDSVTSALFKELEKQTGLRQGDVDFGQKEFAVTLQPKARGEKPYKGVSSTSVDDAIAQATKNGELAFDERSVSVSMTQRADVPYFLHRIEARTLFKARVAQVYETESKELREAYAGRFVPEPDAQWYTVVHTKASYASDDKIPRDLKAKKILAKGMNAESLDAAEKEADKKLNSEAKSTIYMGTWQMKVYGREERDLSSVSSSSSRRDKAVAGAVAAGTVSGGGGTSARSEYQFTQKVQMG